MPYCTQCGKPVSPVSAFCALCGAPQPVAPQTGGFGGPRPDNQWPNSISPSTASTLCYVPFLGWIAALVVLATARFRSDRLVRFHAFQGLYLFVVWMLVDIAAGAIFGFAGFAARRAVTGTLKLSVIAAWIYMLVKTAAGEKIHLPFLGDLAERSVAEQFSGRS